MKNRLVIGSRGSQLALTQTNFVAAQVKKFFSGLHPELHIEIKIIKTTGDKNQTSPLSSIGLTGVKGLFVKEIEEAMLRGEIDAAVHSAKDVPTELPKELEIGAVLKRELPFDVLVSRNDVKLAALPKGARIGTSSLRRKSQLLHYRRDFQLVDIRGNLDTRLRKLHLGNLHAVVVAYAGMKRLGLAKKITQKISARVILPAVGQGALAVEMRKKDKETKKLFALLHHKETFYSVQCERAFLQTLEGGCQVPIGAYARMQKGKLFMEGALCSLDGTQVIRGAISASSEDAVRIGKKLGNVLIRQGGAAILDEIRRLC